MFSHVTPENYEPQLEEKRTAMEALFAEFKLPETEVFRSAPQYYRLRAEFRLWHEGDDLFFIMFNQATKEKFKVEHFPVASTLINQAMTALLDDIRCRKILRERLFQVDFLSTQSGELLISMLYHKQLDDEWQTETIALRDRLNTLLGKVDIVGRARKQKIILHRDFVDEVLHVDGQALKYQQVENSFTQPNGGVNEHMLSWAKKVTKNLGGDLIELYCGNGNFSIALADNFNRVLGTEISKTSVNSAQLNISANQKDNIKIVRISSEEFSQAMNGERTFRRLADIDLTDYNYETVLVDPPRAGLDDDSLELVSRFERIVYISCNPHTLKDNLKTLSKTHTVENFALFDQFPFTDHIETGVYLTKKS
ncbi:tRNA (uridine(54)-C5)-methyltransferase TrmA [Thalassotalea sp. LPB0316]|uniref:tRNA (uridine(54)-C5)-methyltransferase TrmA n=1 Tax=Thalassotalea sp. LPB0316 TaxID=2769490 RepID=UPI001865FB3A|nr:tRNA (uridine(54)-C5)-methyltransferase TrmA [Thalassotalea sp. LPB0316]QOL26026.1 tRNA (uridine(54)-C5)-methyltransferase TrmA [Thalassotalea sp. LPB0316]